MRKVVIEVYCVYTLYTFYVCVVAVGVLGDCVGWNSNQWVPSNHLIGGIF